MRPEVNIRGLSFSYSGSDRYAIKDFSAEILGSRMIALMGREGSGKSTLCFCLSGVIPHIVKGKYSGEVLICGLKVSDSRMHELARYVGVVFQDFESQLFSSNVELEVAFGLENLRYPREEIRRRVERYLSFVGLSHLREREIPTLSGGEKQRLAIASVICMEQPVLALDEPLSELDPEGKRKVLSIVADLVEKERIVFISETDPENVLGVDEIWILKDGELIKRGKPDEIFTDTDLLSKCGIMVPEHVRFLKILGFDKPPLRFEEAISYLEKDFCEEKREEQFEKGKSSGEKILELVGVSFRYPGSKKDSLTNIDFQVSAGDFIAILGKNGSGKTTLAKILCGILKPTSGSVIVKGKEVSSFRRGDLSRIVNYVFQNPDHQVARNTVLEEISFGPKLLGMGKREIEESVELALKTVGLIGYEERSPFLLSKGERQRVAIASILALKPEVIILDEPTTGLDYPHQIEIMEMLKKLNENGHTIIIITHSIWIAEKYARRCVLLKDGRMIKDEEKRQFFLDEKTLEDASIYPSAMTRIANRLKLRSLEATLAAEEIGLERIPLR